MLFGGIFSGATTVTEAALLAVVYALVAGMLHGRHPARARYSGSSRSSGVVTATTLWVLAAASAFAWILVREWVPQMLGEWIGGAGAGRAGFLALTVVAVRRHRRAARRAAGAADLRPDPLPDQPRGRHRPVHYGIVIIAAMGIAFFLPPVGVGLSIAAGIARVDIDDVSRAYVPYSSRCSSAWR